MASPLAGTVVVARVSAISVTFPVTIPAGSDRFLGVSTHLDTGTVVSSVTYAAVAMTLILDQLGIGPGGRPRARADAEVAPPVGTANVVITLASSVNLTGVATPWTGVEQVTGFENELGAAAKTTNPTITITSSVGDEVVDAMSTRDNVLPTVGAGQTVLEVGLVGPAGKHMGSSRETGAASVTMDWTTGSDDFAIVGYNLIAAVVTPPADPTLLVATCVSFSQVDLVWQDNATDEVEYRVERESPIGGGFAEVAVLPANTEAFSDTGRAASTEFNYRVRACKSGSVCSGFSNESACTTPAAPAGMEGKLTDPTSITKLTDLT